MLLIFLSALFVFAQPKIHEREYLRMVGDIPFDPKLDDTTFAPCNEQMAMPYNVNGGSLRIEGGKYFVNEYFAKGFKSSKIKGQTGWITIRFMVSCKGETGRFRMEEMDANYQPVQFDTATTTQLMTLCKELQGWEAFQVAGKESRMAPMFIDNPDTTSAVAAYDYYQRLTFKIKDGDIELILP